MHTTLVEWVPFAPKVIGTNKSSMMQGTYLNAHNYVQPLISFEAVQPEVFRVSRGAELLSIFGTPALDETKLGTPRIVSHKAGHF